MTMIRASRGSTRRFAALALATGSVLLGAATPSVGTARAAHECTPSAPGIWFKTCREIPASLPLTFVRNPVGARVSAAAFESATVAAITTWNDAWPTGTVLVPGGTTSAGLAKDGRNTILWGEPAACGAPGALAVACLWLSGTTPSGAHRIVEVDIVLAAAESWRQASDLDLATGTATGSAGLANGGWVDLQSVLAHELGHALGLDDIGNPTAAWPSAASDAGAHLQTMYRWMLRGSTHARTLDVGDRLGIIVLATQA